MEQRIREIGHELFRATQTAERGWSPGRWVADRFLRFSMRDELLKTQLFRFVDLLPSLCSNADINEHFHECLGRVSHRLPTPLTITVSHWPRDGWRGAITAALIRGSVRQLARRFIPATDAHEAVAVARQLCRHGLTLTVDLLGETVVSEAEALAYQQRYLVVLEQLTAALAPLPEMPALDRDHRGPIPRVNLSLKLSSLFSQFDPLATAATSVAVRDRVRPILRLARTRGMFVNFDMEQFAYKDLILQIFRDVLTETEFRDWPDVEIAMQTYLRDTAADLEGLGRWAAQRGTPVWVRLVKGA